MDRDSTLWSINSSSSSFLYSQSSQLQHPHQEISLDTTNGDSYTSDNDYDDGFSSDSSFDFPVVSLSQLDARRYVYSNGVSVSDGVQIVQQLKVTSTKKAVDMEMIGSDVVLDGTKSHTNMQLMGSFSGDVTVTRIGIRGKSHYKYNPFLKVKMVVQIRKGCAGQCEDTVKLYENVFYPSPSLVNGVSFIDHAKTIHCICT